MVAVQGNKPQSPTRNVDGKTSMSGSQVEAPPTIVALEGVLELTERMQRLEVQQLDTQTAHPFFSDVF